MAQNRDVDNRGVLPMRSPPKTKTVQLRDEGLPRTRQPLDAVHSLAKMNKPTFYSLLAALTILTLGLATLHSRANLDMQWGEHQRLIISPGEAPPEK